MYVAVKMMFLLNVISEIYVKLNLYENTSSFNIKKNIELIGMRIMYNYHLYLFSSS